MDHAVPALPGIDPRQSASLAEASHRISRRVKHCLPWSDMSRIPPDYEAFAARHFSALDARQSIAWSDACPAYALAYLTHTAYGPVPDPQAAGELEMQWEELSGQSRLEWPDAFTIMREAWTYLADRQVAPVAPR